jgi:hypothetical protein
MKNELITKWESGTCLSDLAAQYGTTKSKSTILKNKEAIKGANVAKVCLKPLYVRRLGSRFWQLSWKSLKRE